MRRWPCLLGSSVLLRRDCCRGHHDDRDRRRSGRGDGRGGRGGCGRRGHHT